MNLFRNLPLLNGLLNGLATLLLLAGYCAIRLRRITLHRALMGSAFTVSVLFLVSYLVHHYQVRGHVPFQGTGPVRILYFAILLTHTPLAALVPFLAIRTIYLALQNRLEEHRRAARWTLPVWLYVSVTGVLIYLFVYVWYPAGIN
jgi:putative membrane protein